MAALKSVGAPPVAIRLLGPVQVEVDRAPLTVDTRKAIALLAYLAVTGRPASRETLAALLWPESGDEEARGALRRTLSVLNAGLAGAGIAIDRTSVALRPADVWVDLGAFRAALAQVRDHADDPAAACPACLALLDEALALDRGEFMAGFALRDSEPFDDWHRAEGEAHRRDLAGALERLARGRAAAGASDQAVTAARRWLEVDPLHEPAHRLLMATLARAGEPAAAIGQYRECVRVLDQELGVGPLAETTELYEAIRAGELAAANPPVRRDQPLTQPVPNPGRSPLVGRDEELALLLDIWRSIGPDGRTVVVEGEPGIGKSRLATELEAAVSSLGARVAEVRAYPGEDSIPFAVVAGLVRSGLAGESSSGRLRTVRPELLVEVGRLVPLPGPAGVEPSSAGPAIGAGTADPFGHARLLEGLAEALVALVAGPVPGVIVVDDLQLADASSVELLGFLARRLERRPVLLLITWRQEELADMAALRILGPTNPPEARATRLALGRLDRSAVETLASDALGSRVSAAYVDALFAESEGLPLYVTEALAGADPRAGRVAFDAVPSGVVALLRARIDAVGEVAGQVLAAAAVIGRSFDLETARLASGRADDETVRGIEELVRRGLVRELATPPAGIDGPGYEFTHGRMRDVTYDGLGLARRRLLHRRVAQALDGAAQSAPEGGSRWARIAHHEQLAGRSAEAAEAHRRAGLHARSVFANLEAREHLEAALGLGHPAALDLREALGDVLILLGDYAAAIGQLEAAAAIAPPGRLGGIEHRLGLVHARRGDWARADGHLAAALALVSDDEPGARAAILADRSVAAHRLGDPGTAGHLAAEALALAGTAGDQVGIARAADILGLVERAKGDLAAGRAHLELALAAADRAADVGMRIATRNSLALVCADGGDRDTAIALTLDALELCQRQGDRHRQAALENNLADLLQATGRQDEAMVHLKRAVAIFADIDASAGLLQPGIWKLAEW